MIEGQVAGLIQFGMIEAGATQRIAAGGDEQNYRAEALFALRRANELHELDGFVGQLIFHWIGDVDDDSPDPSDFFPDARIVASLQKLACFFVAQSVDAVTVR